MNEKKAGRVDYGDKTTAERCYKLRVDYHRHGLKISELAEKLGLSESMIKLVERAAYSDGQSRHLSDKNAQKYADFFGVTVEYLRGETDNPFPEGSVMDHIVRYPQLHPEEYHREMLRKAIHDYIFQKVGPICTGTESMRQLAELVHDTNEKVRPIADDILHYIDERTKDL